MTPSEFHTVAVAILGTSTGWQTGIARRLGVNPRTVRRWVAGDTRIPDGVAAELARLAGDQRSERAAVLAWLDDEIADCATSMKILTKKKDYDGCEIRSRIREAFTVLRQAIANGEHVATDRQASCR